MKTLAFLTPVMALLASSALAHSYEIGALKIGHPWTRATPAGSDMAAAYLSVTNTGTTEDTLTAATVEGVGDVSIHDMSMDGGVMKMRPLESGLAIKPGQKVTLQPGGLHLMLMGLKQPLTEGTMVSGTLVFEHAGTLPVGFKVEKVGAAMPAHMGH